VIPHYLGLALWPNALVLDYGVPRPIPIGDAIGGGLLVAALLAITLVALVRWPMPGFLGAVFFLTLAPTSSFVPIMSEVGAERRMYLPLAAIAVLVVMGGYRVLARARSAWPARDRLLTTAALVFAAAWLGSLGVRTAYRNAQYADALSLWGSSVEERPHGRARLAYAMALVNAGQSDAAIPHLREAVRDYEPARYALGVELAARGENAQAIQTMKAFIAADPAAGNRVPARLLLGRLLFADKRFPESAEQFRAVAALSPANIDAQLSLGDLLLTQKRYPEAASQYRVVVSLQPNQADWRLRLGSALAENGQLTEAVEHFRAAVTLDPGNELARSSLNRAEQLLGHP
jgi:tetratricopeptide (TPR) repeat protein